MSENNINNEGAKQLLHNLFEDAKNKDEFEYCSALLRIRGLEAEGWDTLEESYTLLTQTISCMNTPIENGFRIRLLLLAYCHATEMNFLYNMIANMIQIAKGERYALSWFSKDFFPAKSPKQKIDDIAKMVSSDNQQKIADLLQKMLLKDVRNAFDHSDYTLFEDELRIYTKDTIFGSDNAPKSYKLKDIVPILEEAINFVLTLINVTGEAIRSYQVNKKIPSRMLEGDPHCKMMELVTRPGYGLIGMRGVIETESKNK